MIKFKFEVFIYLFFLEKQYTLEGDIVKLKQSSATKDDPSKRKISKLEERLVEVIYLRR